MTVLLKIILIFLFILLKSFHWRWVNLETRCVTCSHLRKSFSPNFWRAMNQHRMGLEWNTIGRLVSIFSIFKQGPSDKRETGVTSLTPTQGAWKLCLDILGCPVKAGRHGKMQGHHGEWQPDQKFKLGVCCRCAHKMKAWSIHFVMG